jgi:hypothetical protein
MVIGVVYLKCVGGEILLLFFGVSLIQALIQFKRKLGMVMITVLLNV